MTLAYFSQFDWSVIDFYQETLTINENRVYASIDTLPNKNFLKENFEISHFFN